jgi:phosphoglycerate kinase
MGLKKIQEANVKNKKVLFRVDFNVAVENGKVKEKFKIQAARETLKYLMQENARVAILTYFGRPGGKKDMNFSLNQIISDTEKILGYKINFVSDCIGSEVGNALSGIKKDEIIMLENVRFYPEEGDVEKGTAYDEEFAKKLSIGFDLFINDAFSQSHRDQASITGVMKYLPSYAGFQLQKEVDAMEKIKNNYSQPAIAIIGGAKIETKLPVIKFFEKKYDFVLVGGKIANEAKDQAITFSEKVILPDDYIGERLDIGPKTIEKFKHIINQAKTIVWNGPMGKFEEAEYSVGTKEILKAVLASSAFTLVGGGETLEILEEENAIEKIGFVSTGGGAMLEYLGGGKMPGIEILLN